MLNTAQPDIATSRASALKAGRVTYEPAKPCPRCSTSLRYARNGTCVECNNGHRKAYADTDAGKANNAERQARYREKQRAAKLALLEDI